MGKKHSNSWAIVVLACTVLLLFVPKQVLTIFWTR